MINERLPSESNEREKNLESGFTCFLSEFEKDICLANKSTSRGVGGGWRNLQTHDGFLATLQKKVYFLERHGNHNFGELRSGRLQRQANAKPADEKLDSVA